MILIYHFSPNPPLNFHHICHYHSTNNCDIPYFQTNHGGIKNELYKRPLLRQFRLFDAKIRDNSQYAKLMKTEADLYDQIIKILGDENGELLKKICDSQF